MPKPVRFELGALRGALLEQAGRVDAQLVGMADDQFALPTRLGNWTVAALAAHLSLAFGALAKWIAAPDPGRADHTLASYYELGPASASVVDRMATEAAASRTPAELRAEFTAALIAVTGAVEELTEDRVLATRIAAVPATDALATRCVEVVVHAFDLQAATGVPAVRADAAAPAALGVCVKVVAAILQERAPGHSVEVRVPGAAGTAFQCGEGPQHTRGTPPNVVETDPITFVELGAGRLEWAAAVASGAVRASGGRADLSPLLPVIG